MARHWSFLSPLSVLLLFSCAGQVPPGGGPVDTTPPEIISVYPAPNTLRFKDTRVVLEFSEYVERRSVEESVFISPPVGPLEFDWSGTEVEISFRGPLRDATTYVVSVGTDVVDIRNRNRMAEAFTLAFSTGGEIDRAAIAGQVYPSRRSDPSAGIMVFAYRLDGTAPDTLNPRSTPPDYMTQTGTGGRFALSHLAFGTYRVFAVRDEYKNLLYDPETDEIGTVQSDLVLTPEDSLRTGLLLRIAREDTTAPRLVKVTGIHERLLLAEFSETLDTGTVRTDRFHLSDTSRTDVIPVLDVAAALPNLATYFLVTTRPMKEEPYRLMVRNVRDSTGHEINPLANSLDFVPSVVPDTVAPQLRIPMGDSVQNLPVWPEFLLTLSEPVERMDWRTVVTLEDSLGREVALQGRWGGSAGIWIRPARELAGLAWYRMVIRQGGLRDHAGNSAADTIRTVNFRTMDADVFGSIEGTVTDWNRSDTIGNIIVRAMNAQTGAPGMPAVVLQKPGPFVLDRLVEGSYVLDAFRDRNGNGVHDAGIPFPFVPSERFAVLPDTLKIRARWPLEGVKIELR